MKVAAIINTSSGGCDAESEAEMLDILKGANVSNYTTWCGEPTQIETAFAEVATQKSEVLVVLGGDGTHPHGCGGVQWNRYLSSPRCQAAR